MLNSAQGVTFPIRDSSPGSLLIGASVKPCPMAPPMMLNPWMCSTTSGNVANRRAALVNVPVAITHGVPFGCARSAFRISKIGFLPMIGGREAFGRRSVPSRPDSPINERKNVIAMSLGFGLIEESPTMDIRGVQCRSREWLLGSRVDRDIRLSDGFQDTSGICSRVL